VNDTIGADVARYATTVRAAFADLPGPQRDLLLEDLEDHLQEVAAEAGGPLEERLGAPEAYAAELRASAGLPAAGALAAGGRRARPRLHESRVARRLTGLWGAALAHPAGQAVAEFLPELRPAWWVVRGYLAVQVASVGLSYLFAGDGLSFPVPELLGSQVLGLLAVIAAAAGSVALGRRGAATRQAHGLLVLANTALAVFAFFLLTDLGASRNAAEAGWDQARFMEVHPDPDLGLGLRADGREISNIFPFDADGKPLRDVYLVDQDGQPVVASHLDDPALEPTLPLDRDGNEVLNRYPQVQEQVDLASGQRTPTTAPAFRPPPGPVRSP
jgi:hypothetical protein